MWALHSRQTSRRSYSILLFLLLSVLAFSSALPLAGAGVDLQELSEDQLLMMLSDNLQELAILQETQQSELQTAQTNLEEARKQADLALTLSSEAQQLSTEAKDLAEQSRNSSLTAQQSFLNFSADATRQLRSLQTQNTWLKIGVGAALTIALGSLVWSAISSGT